MVIYACIQIVLSQIPNFHKIWWLSIVAAIMSFAYSFIGLGLSIAKIAGEPQINTMCNFDMLTKQSNEYVFNIRCVKTWFSQSDWHYRNLPSLLLTSHHVGSVREPWRFPYRVDVVCYVGQLSMQHHSINKSVFSNLLHTYDFCLIYFWFC